LEKLNRCTLHDTQNLEEKKRGRINKLFVIFTDCEEIYRNFLVKSTPRKIILNGDITPAKHNLLLS
jgi:hypothetical protein